MCECMRAHTCVCLGFCMYTYACVCVQGGVGGCLCLSPGDTLIETVANTL